MELQSRALLAAGLLAVAGLCLASALSIEAEPVKVTHRNSGPRYDIERDEEPAAAIDRSKLTPVVEQPQPALGSGEPTGARSQEAPDDSQDATPTGHIHIRRIFLVPMMRPSRPAADWQEERGAGDEPHNEQAAPPPSFAKPFWPFLTPARPAHSHHLFGADEASRSPAPSGEADQERAASGGGGGGGGEREQPQQPDPGMFDPLQMMLGIMHQAIAGQLMPMPGGAPPTTDLNREAASDRPAPAGAEAAASGEPATPSRALAPKPPASQNETREDVVEIEGKKYLRKTVINRHVGENIIFMTKRLIFVPLNETESASNEQPAIPTSSAAPTTTAAAREEATTTTTGAPATTTVAASTTGAPIVAADRLSTEAPTATSTSAASPTTTATATTTTGEPATSSTAAASEPAEATTAAKARESWVDRVSEDINKAVERLIEKERPEVSATTTTTTAAAAASTTTSGSSTTDKPSS